VSIVAPAVAQQAPQAVTGAAPGAVAAPGQAGRGGGGGGFTHPDPIDYNNNEGWTSLFDGSTLNGWDGRMDVWKVENGVITAESPTEKPTGTTYLIWKGGEVADFELKAELMPEGPRLNVGIQYRSFLNPPSAQQGQGRGGAAGPGGAAGRGGAGGPGGQQQQTPEQIAFRAAQSAANAKFNLGGPQFDFTNNMQFTGNFYEGGLNRGEIAWRGEVAEAEQGKKARLLAMIGDPEALSGYAKPNAWNQVHIIAIGHTYIHILNGHLMSVFIDKDPSKFRPSGLLALQIEATGKISYRNIRLKKY
jgi:hypothetical protein